MDHAFAGDVERHLIPIILNSGAWIPDPVGFILCGLCALLFKSGFPAFLELVVKSHYRQ